MSGARALAPIGWGILLGVGQAASLALVEAGSRVGYQHYIPATELPSRAPTWALVVLMVEAAVVAWGLAHRRAVIGAALRHLGWWRVVAIAVVLTLTSAALSREPAGYVAELALASLVQLVHLGAVVLLVLSIRDPGRIAAAAARMLGPEVDARPDPGGPDRFAWVLALGVTLVAAVLALVAYERHPHVPDEVVYLLQSRYLAAGHLSLPLPAVPDAFNVNLMTYEATRWYSPVPPGWPFMLAVGVFLGAAWLVNPVLGGVNVLLAYLLLRELYPRRTARLAVALFAVSPWNLFMAMNLMTHTATLAAALLAALAVARLRRDPRLRWAVVGGIGIAIVGLIRPLEGFAVAMLLGVWSLGAVGRRFRLAPSVTLTLTTLVASAVVLPYNHHLTGSATTFPIMAYTDATYGPGTNALGFGADRGLGFGGDDPLPGHGALDVVINANFNLFQINVELLGWATGSLLLLTLLLTSGRLRRPDWYLLAVIGVIAGIHSFYYFSGGPDFGARYWYLVIVPCIALSARGAEELAARGPADGVGRVLAGMGALVAVTLLVFVPWRASDKYHQYRGMRPDLRAIAADPAYRQSVILVRGNRHPDYASAVVYNPLDFDTPAPLFAWDRGDSLRAALVTAYPGREFWIVDGPTVTGDGYQVRAGPLSGAELVARRDSTAADP